MGERRDTPGHAEPGGPGSLEARLREELRALAGTDAAAVGPSDARRLVAAGQRRAQRRRVRAGALAAAACLAVVVGGAALVRTGDGTGGDGQVESGVVGEGSAPAPVEVPRPSDADTAPSQSPEDAERDGVHPLVAELPQAARVSSRVPAIADGDEVWVASELGVDDFSGVPCTGASAFPSEYGVCADAYGELLRLDAAGRIQRAYPLPETAPQWAHVTDRYVYAGRQGDGGSPDSMLARIDRESGEATVVVLRTGTGESDDQRLDPAVEFDWVVATPEQVDRAAALMDQWSAPGATGTPVESWVVPDPLRIDFAAVDEWFAEVAGDAP